MQMALMKEFDQGVRLRETREAKGISLDEAERATRIKACYLAALESNDWGALPSDVQARGFLRNYATFLGLNPDDEAIESISRPKADGGDIASLAQDVVANSPVSTTRDGTIFQPRDISLGGLPRSAGEILLVVGVLALVIAIAGFGIWLIRQGFASDGNSKASATQTQASASQTPAASADASTPAPSATPTSVAPESLIPTPTFDASSGGIQLNLETLEHVWVRVTVDGALQESLIMSPDTPRSWQASVYVMLETGNAAGLKVTVNGQPQGVLGERGELLTLAWGPRGPIEAVPTPTATATPSQPTVTLTPTVQTEP